MSQKAKDSAHSDLFVNLLELTLLFLRLGATAFGGPAAHISMMEEEVVARRRWLTREEFLDFLGATNLIPGPNSTEMAIFIGRVRAGLPGLLVAGTSFIFPAALMVGILASAYVNYGALPHVGAVVSTALLFVYRVNSLWLVLGGRTLWAATSDGPFATGLLEPRQVFGFKFQ